jgi:dolichol-phosphate mannosyltransferase
VLTKLAFEYAKKNNFDYLITMDADFSHDPKELKNIVENLYSNSFVIGSRYASGGKCLMTGSRFIMSFLGNKIIKIISGIKSNEFTTSYRGFNLEKLQNFHLNNIKYKGYSFFMGTIFDLYKNNINIKEIPIIFQDRFKGKSKIPRFEIFRTLKNLFVFFVEK